MIVNHVVLRALNPFLIPVFLGVSGKNGSSVLHLPLCLMAGDLDRPLTRPAKWKTQQRSQKDSAAYIRIGMGFDSISNIFFSKGWAIVWLICIVVKNIIIGLTYSELKCFQVPCVDISLWTISYWHYKKLLYVEILDLDKDLYSD